MAKKDNAKNSKKANERIGIKEYFKGIKLEMSKVVWPTKKELGSFTAVVIATCAVFALGFWLIDTGVLAALKAVLGITLN
jgi:preprotein translocase subunit SecE